MKKLYFVTGNKHKFQEVQPIFPGIQLVQLKIEKPEIRSPSVVKVAEQAAIMLSKKIKKPFILEDTGIFFQAYKDFPGTYSKYIINTLGFPGIFKLLKNKSKKAYFETAAAYCKPGKKPVIVSAKTTGSIILTVKGKKDVMPYDNIFIPDKHTKVYAEMMDKKHMTSHRVKAFKKLAKYIKNRGY